MKTGASGKTVNSNGNSNVDIGVNFFQDQGTWNSDDQQYSTILVGQQSARRRFDMDKQAVLCQISELDFSDLFPIVLSCQFSLCVFYARAIFVRILRLICNSSDNNSEAKSSENNISNLFLRMILESQIELNHRGLIKLLSLCYRQGQGSASQPERLFPSLLQVFISINYNYNYNFMLNIILLNRVQYLVIQLILFQIFYHLHIQEFIHLLNHFQN